jgi:hypothetical protein
VIVPSALRTSHVDPATELPPEVVRVNGTSIGVPGVSDAGSTSRVTLTGGDAHPSRITPSPAPAAIAPAPMRMSIRRRGTGVVAGSKAGARSGRPPL